MIHTLLTVVIPTRNRPDSLLRLLKSLADQTLPPTDFEVVVVDDGSEPPLQVSTIAGDVAFSVRLVRRTTNHGAHASRVAGLREARSERVLFLDDDVVLDPETLAEHAGVEKSFANGPILYHLDAKTTPYQRFLARRYGDYIAETTSAVALQGFVPLRLMYICNLSGPTNLFADIFEGVRAMVGDLAVPGDGLDEELMRCQMKDNGWAQFLPKARILHVDTKTVAQARRYRRIHGEMKCHLILQYPNIRPHIQFSTSYFNWKVRLLWMTPALFRLIATIFTWLADHGPARWVPSWACYPPLAIAFWEGVNSVCPSYERLRAVLLDGSRAK